MDELGAAAGSGRAGGEQWWDRTAALVIGVGVALRLETFLDRRPLWIDEARLALNVATRGFQDLMRPLELEQSAPIPFLWASRVAVNLTGVNEYSLRLLPLLAGVLLLVVLWRLVRRLLGAPEALFVTILAALSLTLVYYSTEFKQYGVDAAVSVILLAETMRFLKAGAARSWPRLGLAGALALLCSQPAVFLLTGVAAALLADREARTRPSRVLVLLGTWAIVFGGLYVLSYGETARTLVMQRFWELGFLRPGSDLGAGLRHAGDALFIKPLPVTPIPLPAAVVAAAWVAGMMGVITQVGWRVGLLFAIPYLAAATAAGLGLYPIAYRLLLFLAPVTLLVFGGLLSLANRWIGPSRPALVQGAACTAIFAFAAAPVAYYLIHPAPRWNLRSVVASLPPSGTVYVMSPTLPQWAFYTTHWPAPDRGHLERVVELARYGGAAFENAPSRGRAVACEGDELVLEHARRREIIGLSPGTEFRQRVRYDQELPDSGWAENEARRMRNARDSVLWVVATHSGSSWVIELLSGIRRAGGTVVEERVQDRWLRPPIGPGYTENGAAYRVAFPPPPLEDACNIDRRPSSAPVQGR